jgi:hypothetical protein
MNDRGLVNTQQPVAVQQCARGLFGIMVGVQFLLLVTECPSL